MRNCFPEHVCFPQDEASDGSVARSLAFPKKTSFSRTIPPISLICFKQPQVTKQDHWLFLTREESSLLKRRWFLVSNEVSGCSSIACLASHHHLSKNPGVSGQHKQWGSLTIIKNTFFLGVFFLNPSSSPTCLIPWACICMTMRWHKGKKGTECGEVRRNFSSFCCHQKHLIRNFSLSHPLP